MSPGRARLVTKFILRHPLAVAQMIAGMDSARAEFDRLVKQEWLEHPVEFRRTHGFDIYLDPGDDIISSMIGITGNFEPGVTRIVTDALSPGNTVVDVGANIGWYTLLSATIVGDSGRVLAFEPEPEKFQLLRKSVEKNGFRNVQLFQEVASDVDGTARLNLYPGGNKSLFSLDTLMKGEDIDAVTVRSSRLDTLTGTLGLHRVDLAKIHVNGGEPRVISGMLKLIEEGKVRNIALVWNPQVWPPYAKLLSTLFGKYNIYRIDTLSLRRMTRIDKDSLPVSFGNIFLTIK